MPLTLLWSRRLLLPVCPGAGGSTAGAALAEARRAKERTYPEFGDARRCRLVVLGLEVGGRWSGAAGTAALLTARGARRARRRTRSDTNRCDTSFHRPPIPEPRPNSLCGPRASSGYADLRLPTPRRLCVRLPAMTGACMISWYKQSPVVCILFTNLTELLGELSAIEYTEDIVFLFFCNF